MPGGIAPFGGAAQSADAYVSVGIPAAVAFAGVNQILARNIAALALVAGLALATVAAVIRNNGHVNPDAIYAGRGPFTPQDILDSRMVADPFHLLDCSMTAEGGCALVLARADIARDLAQDPIWVLGGKPFPDEESLQKLPPGLSLVAADGFDANIRVFRVTAAS